MNNLITELLNDMGASLFLKNLPQVGGTLNEFLISPNFPIWLLIIKYIFILISLLFLGTIIMISITKGWLRLTYLNNILEFITFRPIGAVKVQKKWQKITDRVKEAGTESDYKLSIMEAETMFIDVLEEMGYSGDSLEERLEQLSPGVLPNKKEILKAHEIRNSVARDPNYEVDLEQAQKVLSIFEKGLRSFQAF